MQAEQSEEQPPYSCMPQLPRSGRLALDRDSVVSNQVAGLYP